VVRVHVLSLILLSELASAAEVTDLPPRFRGDVHVVYGGDFQQVGIAQADPEGVDQTWAIRNTMRHTLGLRLEAAVWNGVVVTVGLPIDVQQKISYPERDGVSGAREMIYEPTTGQGSYASGQPITSTPIVSGGLQGAWFGVAAAPLSESYAFGIPVSSRLDIAVRTPGAKSTMYGPNRGGSPGGAALRLAAAFSTKRGRANPYFAFDYTHEFKATAPQVVLNDGTIVGTDIAVKGADKVDARTGAEIVLSEKPGTDSRVALDLYAGVGYRGWAAQPSGFWLPSVLDTTVGQSVSSGPYLLFRGGGAVDVHLNKYVGLRLGAEGRYITPYTVESAYDVHTDTGGYEVGWTFGVVGRVRGKDDPATL